MKRAVLATIAISLFAGSVAMADSRHDRDDRDDRYSHRYDRDDHRDHNRHDWRNDRDRDHNRRDWRNDRDRDHRDHRDWRNDRRHDHRDDHRYSRWDNRWDNHHYDRRDDRRYNHYDDRRYDGRRSYGYGRSYGYSHRSWHRGGYLPVAYYDYPYRIRSYDSYGLYGPPRGYYWARVDGDAVLAAIATGLIIDAVYDAFY